MCFKKFTSSKYCLCIENGTKVLFPDRFCCSHGKETHTKTIQALNLQTYKISQLKSQKFVLSSVHTDTFSKVSVYKSCRFRPCPTFMFINACFFNAFRPSFQTKKTKTVIVKPYLFKVDIFKHFVYAFSCGQRKGIFS